MNRNFTLLTVRAIDTSDIDLVDDAFGYLSMPCDLEELLKHIGHTPDDKVINELLRQI